MIYVLTKGSGKKFIPRNRDFTFTAYGSGIYVLEDSRAAKIWADEQVLFNDGKIVSKEEAQKEIDTAYSNRNTPHSELNSPSTSKPIL
tara:strand:+ start:212 stop:475 length:264 start_codon:yes stop_codon:yes gene_type:complete